VSSFVCLWCLLSFVCGVFFRLFMSSSLLLCNSHVVGMYLIWFIVSCTRRNFVWVAAIAQFLSLSDSNSSNYSSVWNKGRFINYNNITTTYKTVPCVSPMQNKSGLLLPGMFSAKQLISLSTYQYNHSHRKASTIWTLW